jgi:hypothetical protein
MLLPVQHSIPRKEHGHDRSPAARRRRRRIEQRPAAVVGMSGSARRLWLTLGWLLIGYVVLTFAGAAFQSQLTLGAPASDVRKVLVTSSMTKTYTGLYLELLAAFVFLVTGLLLARLLRGRSETTGWLSTCIAGATIVYVTVQLATSAAGAAALYDGHHGAPLSTVTMVNDIRSFGFPVSGGVAGLLVLAASAALLLTGALPRWFGYAGFVVGVVCIAAVPLVKAGAPQTLLWFAWVLVAGILSVRHDRAAEPAAMRTVLASS